MDGHSTEALALGGTALAAHDKLLGRHHAWTKESARVTADALDALVRTEEAKALRERYSLMEQQAEVLMRSSSRLVRRSQRRVCALARPAPPACMTKI
jgi:hypothetical protein